MKRILLLTALVGSLFLLESTCLLAAPPETLPPCQIENSQQSDFLDVLVKEHVPVSIYLVNGIKLQGNIASHTSEVIFLRDTVTKMVYKNAISTIVPSRASLY